MFWVFFVFVSFLPHVIQANIVPFPLKIECKVSDKVWFNFLPQYKYGSGPSQLAFRIHTSSNEIHHWQSTCRVVFFLYFGFHISDDLNFETKKQKQKKNWIVSRKVYLSLIWYQSPHKHWWHICINNICTFTYVYIEEGRGVWKVHNVYNSEYEDVQTCICI
jgi:hypothetical protein